MTKRVGLLLAFAMSVACGGADDLEHGGERSAPDDSATAPSLEQSDWPERLRAERERVRDDVRFVPTLDEGGPTLRVPSIARATFGVRGARLSFAGGDCLVAVSAIGRGATLAPLLRTVSAEIREGEVRTDHGDGITEWWRALPSGLEHGLTVAHRPVGEGPLRVAVAVEGELTPHARDDDWIELHDRAGRSVASYAHLVVLDADGDSVPGRMRVSGREVVLEIDDAAARYPLRIDPLAAAQEATLTAATGAADRRLGFSVAVSGDGSHAWAVGIGDSHVFVRTGTSWSEEATVPVYGNSVALSFDGTRAAIGAINTAGVTSAAVYVRTGSSWTREGTLAAVNPTANEFFGYRIDISDDGTRVIVGASLADTARGTASGYARVFARTGSTWAPETTIIPTDAVANDYFGSGVALSSDATRALIGMPGDDGGLGDVGTGRVYLRTGTSWMAETTLTSTTCCGAGHDVALTGDGTRAVLYGGQGGGIGLRVFRRTAPGSWSADTGVSFAAGLDTAGSAVDISDDGTRIVVSEPLSEAALMFVRAATSTAWTADAILRPADWVTGDSFGSDVSISSDGARVLVGAGRDDTPAGTDAGSARVFTFGSPGASCTADGECQSGFCTDGVCCTTRCGGGASDCQACSASLTGGSSGTCSALSASVAPVTVCRPASTACDVAESCSSASTTCPADVVAADTVVCRPGVDVCDVAEHCDGTTSVCPSDSLATAGTECRAATAPCDAPETCTGTSAACPASTGAFVAAGTPCRPAADRCDAVETCTGTMAACPTDRPAIGTTTCRPSVSACDRREVCDGVSFSCPADEIEPAGTTCRMAMGPCDAAEACDGLSGICPLDVFMPSGTSCGVAPTDPCDAPDECTGTSAACPMVFQPATTPCGAPAAGPCDAPDHCAGTSADCVETFVSGVQCRPSSGTCDPAELCLGDSAACPPDLFHGAGLVCRAATNASCDPEETCDGLEPTCPTDVTHCTAGSDAGGRTDAAVDGGTAPAPAAGCGCNTAGQVRGGIAYVLVALTTLAWGRRRRRAVRTLCTRER